MSLQETERKIYQRDAAAGPGPGTGGSSRFSTLNPHGADEEPFISSTLQAPDLAEKKELWIKDQDEKKEKRKKLYKKIYIGAGAVALVVGIVWLALYIRKSAFSETNVKVSISGPDKVKSGELVSYDINYQNLNRASLKDAVLYINYSENFKPDGNLHFESEGPSSSKFNIGDIASKSNGKVTLQGKFFGAQDALVYFEIKLQYRSSTFNSNFVATANSNVFISSSPLTLEVVGPQNAATGNAVTYTINYQNTGQEDFTGLKVKVDFSDGFVFSNSEPLAAQDNNTWYVGNLAAGQSGQIKINGIVNGALNEEKTIKASIGETGSDNNFVSFGEAESRLKIIGSPISLGVTVNGKKDGVFVNAGESLLFKINYKNTGPIGLRDVILTVEANSPVLDYSRIDAQGAKIEFDSAKKIITWKASAVPEFRTLAPNQSGEISFSVPVKDMIPVSGMKDKNFFFSAIARMDSPDVPTTEGANKIVASNAVDVKLNSKLLVGVQGFYNDAEMTNTGPLPPKVGQESTFTMHVKIANISNDITDGKVTMTLGPGVAWKNSFLPKDVSVSFNGRTNELVWNVGSLPAGTGVITDPKELIFQVGLTPAQNQAGDYASLLDSTVFSAKDAFTLQALEAKLGAKNTNLMEDQSVGDSGKVVP